MTDKTIEYGLGADPSGFVTAMARVAASAKESSEAVNGSFKKVGEMFEGVQKQIAMLAAVIAGGTFFKEAINESNKLTTETLKLSKMLGVTADEAATLRTALDDIGSSGDDYIDVFTKFARQLKSNEAGLNALGLRTREANGDLRDSNDLFRQAVASVGDYKAGLDQNTYAQTLFGRSIDDVIKFQRLNSEVTDDAKKKNEELFLGITQQGVEATKAYKMAMNDVGDVLLAIKNVIGNAIKPVFTELAQWFAETGPAVVSVFKAAIEDITALFWGFRFALNSVMLACQALIDPLVTLVNAMVKMLKGDFNGARDDLQGMFDAWGNAWKKAGDMIVSDAEKTHKKLTELFGKGTDVAAPTGGKKTMGDFGKSNGNTPEKSKNSQWEAELSEQKLAYQEKMNGENSFAQFSKEAELKFWQNKLAITQKGSADNLSVRRKMADLQLAMGKDAYDHEMASLQAQEAGYKANMVAKLAILDKESALAAQRFGTESKEYATVQKQMVEAKRQAAEQIKQIDVLRVNGARDAQLAEMQYALQDAQFAVQLGTMTQQELLAKQAEFEQAKNAVAAAALADREAILLKDPDRNPVELERLHQEQQALERAHQSRMAQIRNQSIAQSSQYMQGAINQFGSGFQSVLQQTLQGTITLQKAMQGLWQALSSAIAGVLAKIAADWLVLQVKNMIMGKAVAVSTIVQKSAEAGAGGVASMAAAPFPINLGAPAFGAAMAETALAFAPLASAAGGYDIPGTLNPITQLHAREMVLPAKHADVIRSMADSGQGAGGGGGDVHVHINATDAQSVARLFKDNGQHLVAALQQQRRNFAF